MLYRLETSCGRRRKPNIYHRKHKEHHCQNNRGINEKAFKPSFGIVAAEVTPKSATETRTPILEQDRDRKEDCRDSLSDEEGSHTREKYISQRKVGMLPILLD